MATRPKEILSRETFLALLRLHDRLNGTFSALFKEAGLTQAQYNVLRILNGAPKGGVSCQYVGERLLTRVPDVTRLIDRMVAAGLVSRERSTEDRRVVLIAITAQGRKLCASLDEPVMDLHRQQFTHMSKASLEALLLGLEEALEDS